MSYKMYWKVMEGIMVYLNAILKNERNIKLIWFLFSFRNKNYVTKHKKIGAALLLYYDIIIFFIDIYWHIDSYKLLHVIFHVRKINLDKVLYIYNLNLYWNKCTYYKADKQFRMGDEYK